VVSDIIDDARCNMPFAFGVSAAALKKFAPAGIAQNAGRYHIRLQVVDKPGVVADISAILRDEAISMEALIQRSRSMDEPGPVVIVTHETNAEAMRRVFEKLASVKTVIEKPCVMPIEE